MSDDSNLEIDEEHIEEEEVPDDEVQIDFGNQDANDEMQEEKIEEVVDNPQIIQVSHSNHHLIFSQENWRQDMCNLYIQ